jgi:hypothetical protein
MCRGGVDGGAPISMVGMLFMSDERDAVTKAMSSVALKARCAAVEQGRQIIIQLRVKQTINHKVE